MLTHQVVVVIETNVMAGFEHNWSMIMENQQLVMRNDRLSLRNNRWKSIKTGGELLIVLEESIEYTPIQ